VCVWQVVFIFLLTGLKAGMEEKEYLVVLADNFIYQLLAQA
jgi:hypothetical protein